MDRSSNEQQGQQIGAVGLYCYVKCVALRFVTAIEGAHCRVLGTGMLEGKESFQGTNSVSNSMAWFDFVWQQVGHTMQSRRVCCSMCFSSACLSKSLVKAHGGRCMGVAVSVSFACTAGGMLMQYTSCVAGP